MGISIDVWPVRDTGDGMEQCALGAADAIGVYIRNPEAMHIRDFEIDAGDESDAWDNWRSEVAIQATGWAAALAAHIGCDYHTHID